MSGLATVTAAVKSLPLYSVSNCQVTNWDCWLWNTAQIVSGWLAVWIGFLYILHLKWTKTAPKDTKKPTWKTVLARTRSVRWRRAWAFRLPEESISPIRAGASYKWMDKEHTLTKNYIDKARIPKDMSLSRIKFHSFSHFKFHTVHIFKVLFRYCILLCAPVKSKPV